MFSLDFLILYTLSCKNVESDINYRYTKVLRVTILSGQHLPNSAKKGDIVDPYVQVKVRGHPEDKQKQRTKVVKNNGGLSYVYPGNIT